MNDYSEEKKENDSVNNAESDKKRPIYSADEIKYHSSALTNNDTNPSVTISQFLNSNRNPLPYTERQNSSSPPPGNSGANTRFQKAKERRGKRENKVRLTEEVNGYRGQEPLDYLLQYIEGENPGSGKQKNSVNKENSLDVKSGKKQKGKIVKKVGKKLSNPESENEHNISGENASVQDGEMEPVVHLPHVEASARCLIDFEENCVAEIKLLDNRRSPEATVLVTAKSDSDSPSSDSTDCTPTTPKVSETNENCSVEKFIRSITNQNDAAVAYSARNLANNENVMTLISVEKRLRETNELCLVNSKTVENYVTDSVKISKVYSSNVGTYRHSAKLVAAEQQTALNTVKKRDSSRFSSPSADDAHSSSTNSPRQTCFCRQAVEFLDNKNVDFPEDGFRNATSDGGKCGAFQISFGVDDFLPDTNCGGKNYAENKAPISNRVEFAQPLDRYFKSPMNEKQNAKVAENSDTVGVKTPTDKRHEKFRVEMLDFAKKRWNAFMQLPGETTWYKKQ